MADFRPFSTPSPLLIFPSASPTSKLQCTPTRKPPPPIDWTEECYQGMLLEANGGHYHHHPSSTDEQNKNTPHFKNYVAPAMMMNGTLRRHSTPDFMALHHYESLPSVSPESAIDTNHLTPSATDLRLKPVKTQSYTISILPPVSATSSSNSSSNLSIMSSSTSSMSYISSISSSDDDGDDDENNTTLGISVILKPRRRRPRHISMIHEQKRTTDYDGIHTSTSWYSSSTQSISTTLRENQYHERFAKKKSKFSLLVAKMKRAAERPFRMMDDPGV